ncbi:hypothetical protein ISR92_01355 [Patescibacteria group bacterium]|nr:hypothetical protein [Patescibacteria group bacterium]
MKKLLLVLFLLLLPVLASASVFQDPSYYPYEDQVEHQNDPGFFTNQENYDQSCIADGSCSLDQGFNTFVVLSKWAMGILGSISLLFFIIGGIMWLTSGGKPGPIQQGKSIMISTVIGIIIVMSSWLIVQAVLTSLSDRTLQGLDGGSQTQDLCSTELDEGDSCRGNLGICQGGICVEKCTATNTRPPGGGYDCREFTDCDEDSIIRMYCFGSNSTVCCQASQ